MKKFTTHDGEVVILTEETEKHLLAHPEILPILEEVISKLNIANDDRNIPSVEKEVDLERNIGINNFVETAEISSTDKMLFAYRKARKYPTHIVVNRIGEDCGVVTIQLKFDGDIQSWFIMTAYVGYAGGPLEPFYISDKNSEEFKNSLEYWSKHALVYNPEIMDSPYESTWEKELKIG